MAISKGCAVLSAECDLAEHFQNNVLVTNTGGLQLCDFGAYRSDDDSQGVPVSVLIDEHEIMLHKSEPYLSPELRHSGRPTVHSDMWAVSCVCLELFAAMYGHDADLSVALGSVLEEQPGPAEYIPEPIWDVLVANWTLEPMQRLSASSMHSLVASIHSRLDAV
ncbi:hypothetical protein AURDEDRAFT_112890 [Auricularia subglabra TFB-10046 SS5]|nr:hypothetical protein AURDEDRAFT_112890 [Auricularia subglabra TFB-10046 SS5]